MKLLCGVELNRLFSFQMLWKHFRIVFGCLDYVCLSWTIYRTCTVFLLGLHIIIVIEEKGEGKDENNMGKT